ncbi:unnamed protein product [Ectocarpus sp. 12 AP-2014]
MDRGVRKSGQLMNALVYGRLKDVQRMLAAGASLHSSREENIHPIAVAAAHGHVHILKTLVRSGADIEATCTSRVKSNGCCCETNPNWPYLNGFTALHISAILGNVRAMLVLLQLGANPNSSDSKGVTPMMLACQGVHCCRLSTPKQVEMLNSLLKAGADVELEDGTGLLAIHFAASHCETQVVELLLSKAPSTLNHATHNGFTPLAAAAEWCRESTMSLLLSVGASDLSTWAEKGMNSLNAAAKLGKGGSVRFLLQNGLEAVGGKPAIADAMRTSVQYGLFDMLTILLNVEGDEKQEVWANQFVYCSHETVDVGMAPARDFPRTHAIMAIAFGCPLLHTAAKYCAIPAIRVLLSAGALAEKADSQGKVAEDVIGVYGHERNGSVEAAVRALLLKGPAFRARSWAWPATMNATLGRPSRNAHPPSSTLVPKTPMGSQTFRQLDVKLFSKSFDW